MSLQADVDGFGDVAFPNPTEDDKRLYVKFTMEAVQDEDKTAEEGRPIFRDAEFVEIRVPGDKDTILFRPVEPNDKKRFARHYAAFKAGQSDALVGTPLSVVPWLTKSKVEELAYFNIRTVEQLAEIPDGGPAGFPTLKAKAKDFLAAAAGAAPAEALRRELEKRDVELQTLKMQVEELTKALNRKKG